MDKDVEQIMDGLTGDLRVGERYYIFTVTYAYIGHVAKITPWAVHLDNTWIVSQAGPEEDAVTKIIHGKRKPEKFESVNAPLFIARQSIVTCIKMLV